MRKNLIIILLIIILGAFLRFWQIGSVPISPDWDEVALGYNAFSILQTGKDEYGEFLPVVLRSFDDYKPALYTYLVMPLVAVMGLTVEAVRTPSALLGTLSIFLVYLLVKELFKKDAVALITAFLLSISPWHIQFSRIAFESNVGLFFNILGALFFIKGLKKPIYLVLSSIVFALNLYVYQSEKIFTPLLILSLALIFRKQLFSIPRKFLVMSGIVGLLVILPMAQFTFTNKDALARAKGVSIFSQGVPVGLSQKILNDQLNSDLPGLLIDNRRVVYAKSVLAGYLSHFDPVWLFISGDISRHHAPQMGLLYLFELPFLLIGIYYLIFGKFDRKAKLLVFSWLLIVPIPASVTSGVPHAVRTLNFLPTFQILTALGLLWSLAQILRLKQKLIFIPVKYLILLLILSVSLFNFSYYLNQYFVQQNFLNALDWQYGYAKVIPYIEKDLGNYKKIVVSNQPPMDQSYMFFLFYLKYPPSKYHEEASNASGGFRENHSFGNFEFRPIKWENEKRENTLYVGRPVDFGPGADILHSVYYPNGEPAMFIAK